MTFIACLLSKECHCNYFEKVSGSTSLMSTVYKLHEVVYEYPAIAQAKVNSMVHVDCLL